MSTTLVEKLTEIVNPKFGLVKSIYNLPLRPIEPPLHIFIANYQDPVALQTFASGGSLRLATDVIQGSGVGLTRETALWCALGECVERYSASIIPNDSILRASFNDLKDEAIDPGKMILFSDEQYADPEFPFARFDPNLSMDWTPGMNLVTGKMQFTLAAQTYFNYSVDNRQELLDKSYSTGLAAGSDYHRAVLSGLLEVIERDCFSCYWLSGFTPPFIKNSTIKASLPREIHSFFEVENVTVVLKDLTTELGVPCVSSSLVGHSDNIGAPIGSSCHPKPGQAVHKAILESYHTFNWILQLKSEEKKIKEQFISEFADHVIFHLESKNHKHVSKFIAESEHSLLEVGSQDFAPFDAKKELRAVVDKLASYGYEPHVVDLTPLDVEEVGFCVVKVTVPGLQPMYSGYKMQHLDRRRLEKFAKFVGNDLPELLNLSCHPFP